MLFNSYFFAFVFLPIALAGYFAIGRRGTPAALAWLVIASLFFYSWEIPAFLPVLMLSIAFNYSASCLIAQSPSTSGRSTWILASAIAINLAALFWFKYVAWFLALIGNASGVRIEFAAPTLPLGISFFTFTQICYLIDLRQGHIQHSGFLRFALFATFFPHLIAGPILHNKEMMPQFAQADISRPSALNLGLGLSIFVVGLLKKCLIADPTSTVVGPGFAAPGSLGAAEAWHVALSYSLQLYFDFSGYSDMAVGLARMFNVRFPANFNSPYKATSIIDYWQRWHMTLTRYLNLYLYNPVALWLTRRRVAQGRPVTRAAYGTPAGFFQLVMVPTFFTMSLAGIWHGAGAQFLVFGLLHGVYLTVNHLWRIKRGHAPKRTGMDRYAVTVASVMLTYLCVLLGSIFFRAPSVAHAVELIRSMIGFNGLGGLPGKRDIAWIIALYLIIWAAPNCQQVFARYEPVLGTTRAPAQRWLTWDPTPVWAVVIGIGATIGLLAMNGTTEFLYFQF
ncbi:MAG: MBOAT family protein [Alphaproteobacteria bacterium]|nr:MBOAT family protein [Alphaproteobacteria bacterium]